MLVRGFNFDMKGNGKRLHYTSVEGGIQLENFLRRMEQWWVHGWNRNRRVTRHGWVAQVHMFDAVTSFYVNTYRGKNVTRAWQHLLWRSIDATYNEDVEPVKSRNQTLGYTVIISIKVSTVRHRR